jgi:putative tricarboxylic transport membrane protein
MEKKMYSNQILKLIIISLCIVISIAFLFIERGYPIEAQRLPRLVFLVTILIGIVMFVFDYKVLKGIPKEPVFERKSFLNNGTMLLVATVLSILLLKYLGFLMVSFIFMLYTSYSLGFKNKILVVVYAAVSTFVLYYIFYIIFAVQLPQGIIFSLI